MVRAAANNDGEKTTAFLLSFGEITARVLFTSAVSNEYFQRVLETKRSDLFILTFED